MNPERVALSRFPPLQRAQIVELACLEPIAEGLHITHWTSADLARQAIADGMVPTISARTVRDILQHVDLQPHRTRYWKTARLDAQFKERAEQVLWCYANAERLARQGIWTGAVDEIPNFQVLERQPIRRAIPGGRNRSSATLPKQSRPPRQPSPGADKGVLSPARCARVETPPSVHQSTHCASPAWLARRPASNASRPAPSGP